MGHDPYDAPQGIFNGALLSALVWVLLYLTWRALA